MILGIDLNHYRPNVSLEAAMEQGVGFLISKCSQGEVLDETYLGYQAEAKGLELPFGGYCYWDAKIDPIKQGAYLAHNIGETELLPILDVEKYGNQGILSQVNAVAHIKSTLETINTLTERAVMIYTNKDSWQVITGNAPIIADYPLWVANWGVSSPNLPIGANNWVFWQWTNSYNIGGYIKGVDANYYNGDAAKFQEYLESIAIPIPPPAFPKYVAVTYWRNSVLRGTPNGAFVTVAAKDEVLKVIGQQDDWYQVSSGLWIPVSQVEEVDP